MKGKTLTGTVVGVGMAKTVAVKVIHLYRHPLYRKAVRRTKSYLADTQAFQLAVGDRVRIVETRPLSRRKHFLVVAKLA